MHIPETVDPTDAELLSLSDNCRSSFTAPPPSSLMATDHYNDTQ